MWGVFAVHLREGWNGGGGSDVGRSELLAREVDAELFVLFVRNLHVTSSVASPVGKLCTELAHEVRQSGAYHLVGGMLSVSDGVVQQASVLVGSMWINNCCIGGGRRTFY